MTKNQSIYFVTFLVLTFVLGGVMLSPVMQAVSNNPKAIGISSALIVALMLGALYKLSKV